MAVPTSITAFVGSLPVDTAESAVTIAGFTEWTSLFGGPDTTHPLGLAVQDFFANGGVTAVIARNLIQLDSIKIFNLLCLPEGNGYPEAAAYCRKRGALLIVDPPAAWPKNVNAIQPSDLGIHSRDAANAAVYFPRVVLNGQVRGACGMIAGVMARTDQSVGVWKAPAGQNATLKGAEQLEAPVTDALNARLTSLGINCLRSFQGATPVVWGARTLADGEFRYIPVRRLALMIEETVLRETQWAAFEPNDEALWAAIRKQVFAFLLELYRAGAFCNFHVQCDAATTTKADIDAGIVNIQVLFAPLKPAEFVVLRIQQSAAKTT